MDQCKGLDRRKFIQFAVSSAGVMLPVGAAVRAAPCPPATLSISGSDDPAPGSAIFADDFKGVRTTLPDGVTKLYPDTKKWAFTFLPGVKWPDSYGDGTNWLGANQECQTYVSPFLTKVKGAVIPANLRYDPFSIQQDGLHIRASLLSAAQQSAYQVGSYRRFGSGILISRKSFTYGNVRMVCRMPSARGSWPAFWLLPESPVWPPEIDIFEGMAWGPHAQQIHVGLIVPKGASGSFSKWQDLGFDPSRDFHEYGLNWSDRTIAGLVDGKVLWERPTPDSMKQNMYLLINLAVGGKWVYNEAGIQPVDGVSEQRLNAGSDLIQSDYPAELIVKSVSVTAAGC